MKRAAVVELSEEQREIKSMSWLIEKSPSSYNNDQILLIFY